MKYGTFPCFFLHVRWAATLTEDVSVCVCRCMCMIVEKVLHHHMMFTMRRCKWPRCVTCSFSLCRCRTCVRLMLMSVTLCNCCDVTALSFLARFHVEICCFNPRGSAQWYNLAQNLTFTRQTHKLGRCLELRDVNCKKNLFILVTPKPVLYIYFECFNLL